MPFAGCAAREMRVGALGSCSTKAACTSAPTSNASAPIDGPEPCHQAIARHAELRQCRHRAFDDAGGETAPARMRDADCRSFAVGEKHRQAIGDEHRADDAAHARDGGIGGRGVPSAAAEPSSTATSMPWVCASHRGALGRNADSRRRFSATASALIAHARAEVHRRAGAGADAAGARRHESADRRRRGPGGNDPVEARAKQSLFERRHRRGRARNDASSSAKSAGSGERHSRARRVAGCTSPRRAACSACRPNCSTPFLP